MPELEKRVAALSPAKQALLQKRLSEKAGRTARVGIERRTHDGPVPLSFSQERFWFLDQLDPASTVYTIPVRLRLRGELDVPVLQRSVNEILRRHEALRTCFRVVDRQPAQAIEPFAPLEISVVDLSGLPDAAREEEAFRWCVEEAQRPFDLTRDLMLRAKILRLGERDHLLFLNRHHIATDGWSFGVFLRELWTLYRAFSEGLPSPLPELPVQYADYAAWQREWLQGDVLEKQLDFWRKQLAGAPALLEVPADRRRPAEQTYRGATVVHELPAALSLALGELSRRESVTPFMTLLTAFQIFLHRHTGRDDIPIGSPIAARSRAEIEGLIGFFANTLVFRGDLSGNPTFRAQLRRTREVCMSAYAHQELPFERLVKELRPKRDMSHAPIFQVMFVLQDAWAEAVQLPALQVEPPVLIDNGTAEFDLTLSVEQRGECLRTELQYHTDLFEAETAGQMLHHFQRLLESIIANPDEAIGLLPLLSRHEREALLDQRPVVQIERRMDELLDEQARQTPDAPAVVFENQRWTYRELHKRAGQIAAHLSARGIGPDVLVGLYMERSPERLAAWLGILKAGGACVPLDPAYPPERLAFILDDAQAPLVLTQRSLAASLPGEKTRALCTEEIGDGDEYSSKNGYPSNLAYVIYTSGSTGRPKGVMVEHRALASYTFSAADYYGITSGDRVLQFASMSFDASLEEICCTLARGATLFLRSEQMLDSIESFAAKCSEWNLSVVSLPTAFWHEWVSRLREENAAPPESLRLVIIGGERASPECVARWSECLPGIRLINTYGPTEATIAATAWTLPEGRRFCADREVPIGKPFPHTEACVLDRNSQLVPAGALGELHLGGAALARGYLNQPEMTRAKFIAHPFRPGERLYKTGDLARLLPDGNLVYHGRADDQVKIRGFRIEPGEVETLLRQHPSVRDAAVIAREDTPGEKRLVAYLVRENGIDPDTANVRAFLKAKLPDYMLPSAFVALPALPLTANGKVDRAALPQPDAALPAAEKEDAPGTALEERLAQIWSEVLGTQAVGATGNFFALGGHSLLAMRLISRVRESFAIELPVRSIFENQTVRELAHHIEREQSTQNENESRPAPIPRVSRDADLPLSFAQQRLWLLDRMEPGGSSYSVPVAFRLTGKLDAPALERSIGEIIRRHESLRTVYSSNDGSPVQRITVHQPFHLPVASLDADAGEHEIQRWARDEASRPFKLDAAPLLRASLLCVGAREHVLLATIHHIATDGWSMDNFAHELTALYGAFANGAPSPLPELPIQYADFAVWQRAWLQGERLDTQLSYWRERLGGTLPRLELTTDHARPVGQSHEAAKATIHLSKSLTDSLRAIGQQGGATLFMTLLAVIKVLLQRCTAQEDIIVGTPIANRTRSEFEGLIGFFVNTLAMRTDLSGDPTFRELLARVRDGALGAYAHQDLPFEKLVEEIQPERSASHTPLFEVMFALENRASSATPWPGLLVREFGLDRTTAKFDLTLLFLESGDGLDGSLIFKVSLFERETIERMAAHLAELTAGIVANPDERISRLPLMTAAERQRLVVEWNATATELPAAKCVHELFEEQVAIAPEAVAVVFGKREWSYREINVQANRLAHFLRKSGVGADVPVGLCMERSAEMIVALLGILKAGGCYVALEANWPVERLAMLIDEAGAPVVLTSSARRARFENAKTRIVCMDGERASFDGESDANPHSGTSADHLVYISFTSGSTGRPKGVCLPHRAVVRLVRNTDYARLAADEVFLQLAPLAFDASTFEIWGALLNGARVVVYPPQPVSLAELGEVLQRNRVTTLWLTAGLFHQMVEHRIGDLRGVRQLLSGGDVLSVPRVRKVLEALPECALINGYGPTENTTFTCCHRITAAPPDRSIPIGKPIANTTVYILDPQRQPVPIGVAGELCTGGDGLARGYLNRPELDAEKFVPDPFSAKPGAKLYKTGDRARWLADGTIEFLGRMDWQVKIRGFRIEVGEIEAALGAHPAIKDCAVIARTDSAGEKQLAAYVVAKEGAKPSVKDLRAFLAQKLPDYMIPGAFAMLEGLPLMPNGKLDRNALPEPDMTQRAGEFVPPGDELETSLARIWEKQLRRQPIGVRDNFFDLGGHSLLAVSVFAEIEKKLGKNLPLATLFHAPTIEHLANALRDEGWVPPWSPLVAIKPEGSNPILFCVHGADGGVLHYKSLGACLQPEQPFYGLQSAGLDGGAIATRTIEEFAESYIKEIRRVQPRGPYLLSGYSSGGLIAYEMAQQLQANSDEVALLVLFDTTNPLTRSRRHTWAERCAMRRREVKDLAPGAAARYLFRRFHGMLKAQASKRMDDFQKIFYRRELRRGLSVSYRHRHLHVREVNRDAYQSYEPKPYCAGRLKLFRANSLDTGYTHEDDLGWNGMAPQGLDIIKFPAPHEEMFKEPNVRLLAAELSREIHVVRVGNQTRSIDS